MTRAQKLAHISTAQLKESIVDLYKGTTEDQFNAYQMVFDELDSRMNEKEFDKFCEQSFDYKISG